MCLETLGFVGFAVSALFFLKSWTVCDLRIVATVVVGLTIPTVLVLLAEEESTSLAKTGSMVGAMTKESVFSMLQDAFV